MKENYISQIFYGCFEMFLKENANLHIQSIESIIVIIDQRTTSNDRKDEQPNFDQIETIIKNLIKTSLVEETSIEKVSNEAHINGELVRKNGTPESVIATNFIALIGQTAIEMEEFVIQHVKALNRLW